MTTGSSPSPARRRCGCDCKNESTFVACSEGISYPGCEHCRAAPSAYVAKLGCAPLFDGHTLEEAELIPLWRECLFEGDACRYTWRYLTSGSGTATGGLNLNANTAYAASEDYMMESPFWPGEEICKPLTNTTLLIPGIDLPFFIHFFPPVWREAADGPIEYKRLPYEGCCFTPAGHRMVDGGGDDPVIGAGPGTHYLASWFDFYELCMTDFYHEDWPPGYWFAQVVVDMTITGPSSAEMVFYGLGDGLGSRIPGALYNCDDFDCTGDHNTFLLDKDSLDEDSGITGLPIQICVSRYADNFRTPCDDGQKALDCCDPGYGSAPFVLNAPGCGIHNALLSMGRLGSRCFLDSLSDWNILSVDPYLKPTEVCDISDPGGDCSYFMGSYNTGCKDAEDRYYYLILQEWCSGGEWHLHLWCTNLVDECEDLGEDSSAPNCSCPTGADPSFSIDLGPCCCGCDPASCCPDGEGGDMLLASTLYATFHTADSDCLSGLNGLVVTLSGPVAPKCDGAPEWTGTATPPGGACPITVLLSVSPMACQAELRILDGSGTPCTTDIPLRAATNCEGYFLFMPTSVRPAEPCYDCMASDPDGGKSCQFYVSISP